MQLSDRIGRRMKLHDLHVLMAVVQAGSMSKAATLLNTTQPAISRSIAELGTYRWRASARSQPPGRRADRVRSRLARWRSGRIR